MFFEIAGIHDSVPNQKRKPHRNHIAADFRSELRRERTSSGVNANATAQTSPIGGNTAHRRSADRTAGTKTERACFMPDARTDDEGRQAA